jgi:hypothetical protein
LVGQDLPRDLQNILTFGGENVVVGTGHVSDGAQPYQHRKPKRSARGK